jgi:hypothetical protein
MNCEEQKANGQPTEKKVDREGIKAAYLPQTSNSDDLLSSVLRLASLPCRWHPSSDDSLVERAEDEKPASFTSPRDLNVRGGSAGLSVPWSGEIDDDLETKTKTQAISPRIEKRSVGKETSKAHLIRRDPLRLVVRYGEGRCEGELEGREAERPRTSLPFPRGSKIGGDTGIVREGSTNASGFPLQSVLVKSLLLLLPRLLLLELNRHRLREDWNDVPGKTSISSEMLVRRGHLDVDNGRRTSEDVETSFHSRRVADVGRM